MFASPPRPAGLCLILPCLLGSLAGCDKSNPSSAAPSSDKSAVALSAAVPVVPKPSETSEPSLERGTATEPAASQGENRLQLTWEQLSGDEPRHGLAPREATPEPDPDTLPSIAFVRIAGGPDMHCGAQKGQNRHCWGRTPTYVGASYIDVAVNDDGTCYVFDDGKAQCSVCPLDKDGARTSNCVANQLVRPPAVEFKRIAGAGHHFCGRSATDEMYCWSSNDSPALTPPAGLEARYHAVGDSFACAANQDKQMVCWGDTEPLELPAKPFEVRDIAALASAICVIEPSGSVRCFGPDKPKNLPGNAVAISAGYGTLCAIRNDRSAACTGTTEVTFAGPVKQLSVANNSACAMNPAGRVTCKGDAAYGQLAPPRENTAPYDLADSVDEKLFERFLALFPRVDLPLDFTRSGSISLGGRVPLEFAPLLGFDPNEFRAGVRFQLENGVHGVTVYHLPARSLELLTFTKRGKFSIRKTLAKETVELGDAPNVPMAYTEEEVSDTTESRITAAGIVEVTAFSGTLARHFAAPRKDGSQALSSATCTISKTTSSDEITARGQLKRKAANVTPVVSRREKQPDCQGEWPFEQYPK